MVFNIVVPFVFVLLLCVYSFGFVSCVSFIGLMIIYLFVFVCLFLC